MPENPATGSSGLGRGAGGTRVIWRKLDCLNPNLQSMQIHIHRKGPLKPVSCSASDLVVTDAPLERETMSNEDIQGDEWDA